LLLVSLLPFAFLLPFSHIPFPSILYFFRHCPLRIPAVAEGRWSSHPHPTPTPPHPSLGATFRGFPEREGMRVIVEVFSSLSPSHFILKLIHNFRIKYVKILYDNIILFFVDMTPCSLVKFHWLFRGTCSFHLQGRRTSQACRLLLVGFVIGLLFDSEDGGSTFLRKSALQKSVLSAVTAVGTAWLLCFLCWGKVGQNIRGRFQTRHCHFLSRHTGMYSHLQRKVGHTAYSLVSYEGNVFIK
jgi:hypothetical protein